MNVHLVSAQLIRHPGTAKEFSRLVKLSNSQTIATLSDVIAPSLLDTIEVLMAGFCKIYI